MNAIVKEGDLYKIITVFGKTFELRYGYYAENERQSKFNEVTPIYPDFRKDPLHTMEGYPFVTQKPTQQRVGASLLVVAFIYC